MVMAIVLHLTTVHPRSDTRIFLKDAQTLAMHLDQKVMLIVADGAGNVEEGPKKVKLDEGLIKWAVQEIRDLDALCRSMVPAYEPLDSGDMDKIHLLERLAESPNTKVVN